ncbi:Eukaryotic aspartyl protease family protein [Raphanus sativus]|uniref:Probable aspartic proteinase GIP2 n=1 Tax=Raphanus sativus TaxID=3726 RepID=A0A9W3C1E1_RAPSA|nr:probable aspartic proteinase GIP2 [Raphanus sativus]KAJ4885841.1 Eukaryotic aspartyl protease family protein [Raphanus sativus]
MARLFIFLNIFFVLTAVTTSLTKHKPKQKPRAFAIPILKDTISGLYYTNMTVGKPPLNVNLVLDVTASALYFNCRELGYNSTTYTPVLCGSRGCAQTKDRCTTCFGPFGPTCRNDTCISGVESDLAFTPTVNYLVNDDLMILRDTSPSAHLAPIPLRASFACVGDGFQAYTKLPYGSNGGLGLGNTSTSFVNAIVSSYKIPFKVALCLPSKPGNNYSGAVYIGGSPYVLPPNRKDVTGLLVSTPLTRFALHGGESARISSSLIPYGLLETSIYKSLVKAFAGKAKKRKAVAPFTDCFSYKSFGGKSLLDKEIPVISLVMGGGAKWNIYGPDSLVKVKKTVVCLAFIDAGVGVRFPVEIGGYQVEDNLIEFDLEASKFSFTSSLLLHNTSCSRPLC